MKTRDKFGIIATLSLISAIAIAVYYTTEKRIRDLPIMPDKLL